MQKDINTNDHVCIQTGKHATHNGWVIDIRDKIAKVMLDEDLNNDAIAKCNIEVKLTVYAVYHCLIYHPFIHASQSKCTLTVLHMPLHCFYFRKKLLSLTY